MSLLLLLKPRFGSLEAPTEGASGGARGKRHKPRGPRYKTKHKTHRIPLRKRKFIALRRAERALPPSPDKPRKTIPLYVIKQILRDLSEVPKKQRRIVSREIIEKLLTPPKRRPRRILRVPLPDPTARRSLVQLEYLAEPVRAPELIDLEDIRDLLRQPQPIQIPDLPEVRAGSPFGDPYTSLQGKFPVDSKDKLLIAFALADNEEELMLYLVDLEGDEDIS